MNDLTKTLEY